MGNCCGYLFRRCFSKEAAVRPESPYTITKEDLISLSVKYPECFEEKKGNIGNNIQIKTINEPCKKHKKIKWKEGEVIGHGSFGRVVSGLNLTTGEIMAVKQVHIGSVQAPNVKERIKALELEVEVLSDLNHKNIVRYIGTEKTKTTLNIFLEYISGGSIASLINKYGKLNETLIRLYVTQILEGLEYLHLQGTIHRDIKGANILVDNHGNCKLADFGSAKHLYSLKQGDSLNSLKGTANWMAPEAIMQKDLSRFSDIWSIGCIIIEMATGRPPWSEYASQITAMFQIAQSRRPPAIPSEISPECLDFLKSCFRKNPKERPNVTKLLHHKFITGNESIGRMPNHNSAVLSTAGNAANESYKIQYKSVTPEKTKISRIFEFGPRESTEKTSLGPKSSLTTTSNLKVTLQSQTTDTTDSKAPRFPDQKIDTVSLKEQGHDSDFTEDNTQSTITTNQKNPTVSKGSHQVFYKGENTLKTNLKKLLLFKQTDIERMPRFATKISDQSTPPKELIEPKKSNAVAMEETKKWGHEYQNSVSVSSKKMLNQVSTNLEKKTAIASDNKLIVPKINTLAVTEEVTDYRIQLSENSLKTNNLGRGIKDASDLELSNSMNPNSFVNFGNDESTDNLKVKGLDQLNGTLQDEPSIEVSFEKSQSITTPQKNSPFPLIFTEKFHFEVIEEENDNIIGEIPRKKKR